MFERIWIRGRLFDCKVRKNYIYIIIIREFKKIIIYIWKVEFICLMIDNLTVDNVWKNMDTCKIIWQ